MNELLVSGPLAYHIRESVHHLTAFDWKLYLAAEALRPRTLRVLFIGNSYTYGNDLPGLIAQLLPARGIKLEHESVTPGGATTSK